MTKTGSTNFSLLMAALWACGGGAALAAGAESPAAVDPAPAAAAATPGHQGTAPVAVTVYEFRSNVSELSATGTTDMFITQLTRNAKFRVLERARLSQGVVAEKQLNSQGLTTGDSAHTPLAGAAYIFEGAVSEVNPSETQHSTSVGFGGMSVGHGTNNDSIAVDVRVVDATTGGVVASVTTRRGIKAVNNQVSGLGSLFGAVLERKGIDPTYAPDLAIQRQRKESLDGALRAAIDDAITQLSAHF